MTKRERHKKYIYDRYHNDPVYRSKHIAYQANVRKKLKEQLKAIVSEIKKQPCKDCGQNYPPYVLQFDHRPGEIKKFNIASGITTSLGALKRELAKCDLVCANCHCTRTHFRGQQKGISTRSSQ